MANCRCVLGVESGRVRVRPRGRGARRVLAALVATAAESAVDDLTTLPRWEDVVYYRTISPRHFEAAALRVCQVLFEGRYSGVMEPMRHYIPLRKDFSNFDEVRRADPRRRRCAAS